ncbi:NADPH:quinone oxidoreductase family protein [Microbacterium halimionae]|uniref:NADPH:quinone oxidoreductase family protein n=1 Tax=Microbacterium halimionae TaxID=1526413 RepID=UPI001FBB4D4F|nr:NADPH:quinone oxidoreductase family protein [Microbacterium halimionae]NII95001.1 NADPH2:quinone reductase [Microbacterium halimionae]
MTLPDTMRAWRVTRLAEPNEALSLDELPMPTPSAGEVLVRVRAVAANFPDVLLCRGEYQVKPALPFVPGIEFVGDVVAYGSSVDGLEVGARVLGSKIGVLSEYAVLPASDVWAAPESLPDVEASGLTVAYQTAWFALHRRAALQSGEWLLVHAAAGGVGLAAVQLGAAAGAHVVGVVGSAAKAKVARDAGADIVLVRGTDDIVTGVKSATGGRGADVVFDPVGGDAFVASTRCIAFEGRIIVVGFAGGTIQELPAGHVLVKNYSVVGLHWGMYPGLRPDLVDDARAGLTRLAEAGSIRPVVDHVVPFDRAPEALTALAGGATVGRVVIQVG